MARARRKTADPSENPGIRWALTLERFADVLNPERYPGRRVGVTSEFLGLLDQLIDRAISVGAIPVDTLLQLRIYEQAAAQETPPNLGLTVRILRGWVALVVEDFGRLPTPGLAKFVDGREGANLDLFEFSAWLRHGLLALAAIIRDSVGPFVPNAFQKQILAALDGRALKKMDLAKEVCGGECNGNLLYRPGGIRELRDRGSVKWKSRLGFYRPDRPPPGTVL